MLKNQITQEKVIRDVKKSKEVKTVTIWISGDLYLEKMKKTTEKKKVL